MIENGKSLIKKYIGVAGKKAIYKNALTVKKVIEYYNGMIV
jgi:hypothetical protein